MCSSFISHQTIRGGWGQRSDLPSTPERRRPSHQRSSRQGPSQRKIRRWNNDRFVGVAAELARSSAKGPAAAEAFLRGEADAPMYLIPNHPCKYRSEFARCVGLSYVLLAFVHGFRGCSEFQDFHHDCIV